LFLLASYEKMVKYLADNFQSGVAPLKDIARSQEIIIVQNKQIIALLEQIRCNGTAAFQEVPSPVSPAAPDQNEIDFQEP
jgi:hypothetical protein